jgi:hypothetical protein
MVVRGTNAVRIRPSVCFSFVTRRKSGRAALFACIATQHHQNKTKTGSHTTGGANFRPILEYNSDIVELDHCDLSKRQVVLAESEDLLQQRIGDEERNDLRQSLQA